jgi:hypothetical protein
MSHPPRPGDWFSPGNMIMNSFGLYLTQTVHDHERDAGLGCGVRVI